MLEHCIRLVMGMISAEPSEKYSRAILYACQNWSYHLASSLAREEQLGSITQVQALEGFVSKVKQQGLRYWLYGLYDDNLGRVYINTNIMKIGNAHDQLDIQIKVPSTVQSLLYSRLTCLKKLKDVQLKACKKLKVHLKALRKTLQV